MILKKKCINALPYIAIAFLVSRRDIGRIGTHQYTKNDVFRYGMIDVYIDLYTGCPIKNEPTLEIHHFLPV